MKKIFLSIALFAIAFLSTSFDDVILVPDPSDCSKFFKCQDGVAFSFSCPADLLYNPVTEVCDWPENVNCDSSGEISSPAAICEASAGKKKTCASDECEVTVSIGVYTVVEHGTYWHCKYAEAGTCKSSSCDAMCDAI